MVSKLFIIGIGPGNPEYLTKKAIDAISGSDIIFGADKVLQNIRNTFPEKKFVNEYRADKIYEMFGEAQTGSICFSGSINLYSGASNAIRFFKEKNIEIEEIDGISSVSYFLSKIHIPENEVKIVSVHGRDFDVLSQVRTHKYTAVLLSSTVQLIELAKAVNPDVKLADTRIYLGENLSLKNEKITIGNAREFTLYKPIEGSLAIAIFQNDHFDAGEGFFIPDSSFVREYGDSHSKKLIPMTKENIRTLALEILLLKKDSVLFDIGSGTGSISIAAGMRLTAGKVYSFERNKNAVNLCKKNIAKFNLSNVEIVEGEAPQVFGNIIAQPTHAFIGGAGRGISDIVDKLISINPDIRIVATAVTLETISECGNLPTEFPDYEFSFSEIAVTEYLSTGKYHIRKAQNPVMIMCMCPKN